MDLRPVGGIFWRLDSSGNLTAYDTAGNVLGKFVGTKFSGVFNASVVPGQGVFTTTSTTPVSTGQGTNITLQVSSRIMISAVHSYLDQTTANGTVTVYPYWNTTGIPAAGAAATGTQVTNYPAKNPSITLVQFLAVQNTLTGLALNTQIFVYFAMSSPVGTDTVAGYITSLLVEEI
jgi:hypothetical protein